ncbi:MAG: sodium:proton antiporter [Varibaculum cambriense]|nr:sodium:proton antiporter [Varibaculum cambriense]
MRNWLMLVAVGLLIAAICFAIFGFTHVISPATAIGNAAGFLITSLVVGFFALRK